MSGVSGQERLTKHVGGLVHWLVIDYDLPGTDNDFYLVRTACRSLAVGWSVSHAHAKRTLREEADPRPLEVTCLACLADEDEGANGAT